MPIDPVVGGAMVSGGLNLGGQLLSGGMSRRKAGRQFRHNKQLAEYSFDRQYQMWDEAWKRETEYNDPSAQMERYRQAGINPHMAYMNGGGQNTAQTGALPQYNQETNDVGGMENIDLSGLVNQYMNTQVISAELKKKKAEADQERIKADIMELNKREHIQHDKWTKKSQAGRGYTEYVSILETGTSKKGNLNRYADKLDNEVELSEIQKLVSKAQAGLADATAKNLLSNDEMISLQTDILRGQAAFLQSDTWKKLPAGLQAIIMALATKLGLK